MARLNYDPVARTYQQGRGAIADIDECWAAVRPHLPTGPTGFRVLDLGAGTGIFARVWPSWGARRVVAVEPSEGMLAEALRTGLPAEARALRGRGETIPLTDASVDVAWLSTVYHHLADPARAIAELRRVVAPGGLVFLRGVAADLGVPGWCRWFPGGERALGRFTTLADMRRAFEPAGFEFVAVEACPQPPRDRDQVVQWIRTMRDADSFLVALTPDEVDAGIAALESAAITEIDSGLLHIAVFRRL